MGYPFEPSAYELANNHFNQRQQHLPNLPAAQQETSGYPDVVLVSNGGMPVERRAVGYELNKLRQRSQPQRPQQQHLIEDQRPDYPDVVIFGVPGATLVHELTAQGDHLQREGQCHLYYQPPQCQYTFGGVRCCSCNEVLPFGDEKRHLCPRPTVDTVQSIPTPVITPNVNYRPPSPVAAQLIKKSRDVSCQVPVVADRYQVKKKVGKGSWGEVYLGFNIFTGEEVAIKFERSSRRRPSLLRHESEALQALQGGAGIPQWMYYGEEKNYQVLVTQLLGPTLMNLFHVNRRFSIKTTLMIADQLLSRLEHMHSKNYVHRDLRPENILVGLEPGQSEIFLIDFGLAKLYRDPQSLEHIPEISRKVGIVGTASYASLKNHQGFECSRKDDLESLAYLLIFFAKGKLPWQDMVSSNVAERVERIGQMKMNTPVSQLCEGLPGIFAQLVLYSRNLGFFETPDYSLLHQLIRLQMVRLGINYDNCFDWSSTLCVLNHRNN